MKKYISLFLVLLICLDSFSQNGNLTYFSGDNQKAIIKINKIRTTEIYNYTFKKDLIKDSTLIKTLYYDSIGDLVKVILPRVKKYKEAVTEYQYLYNGNGFIKNKIENNLGLDIVTINEFDYDSLGNEIYKYDFNKDTTRLTIEQKIYNDKNQVKEISIKINNNEPYISRRYFYNIENNVIKIEGLDRMGETIFSILYEYDKSMNKKSEYSENGEGKKLEGEYFYNSENQCIKINSIHKNVVSMNSESTNYERLKKVTENKYNLDKSLSETNIYLNGRRYQTTKYFYNRN